jgi:tryptophan halogenase
MDIKSICVVGGGSAGWMTAASLSKYTPNIKVTLIESPNVGTIGVGESTLGHFNNFLRAMEIKDEDWMAECNATYKTSIKFTDWNKPGESFHYPFGKLDFSETPNGTMDWFNWAARDPDNTNASDFAELYHPSITMVNQNKLTKNTYGEVPGFNFANDTAYHMDATLFGHFLKTNFCDAVTHIQDHIESIPLDAEGAVASLVGKSDTYIADLYIDCTGFTALLLDKTLHVPFSSFNDVLLNDKACAAQIPYIDKNKEMESVTNCTAIENGWVWNIPLYTRIGTGYVYSSKYATEEEAEEQFRTHLAKSDPKRAEEAKVFHLSIKHGIHEKSWVKNVVGVGLASGFIEPLESTGLMLTHENILFLIRALTRRDAQVNKIDIDCFNDSVRTTMEGFRQFISQHYAFAGRCDTPYWKAITNELTYSSELEKFKPPAAPVLDTFKATAYNLSIDRTLDESSGLLYILAGQGYNPTTTIDAKMDDIKFGECNWKTIRDVFVDRKKDVQEFIDLMPTHYEFLTDEFYSDKEVRTGSINNGQ